MFGLSVTTRLLVKLSYRGIPTPLRSFLGDKGAHRLRWIARIGCLKLQSRSDRQMYFAEVVCLDTRASADAVRKRTELLFRDWQLMGRGRWCRGGGDRTGTRHLRFPHCTLRCNLVHNIYWKRKRTLNHNTKWQLRNCFVLPKEQGLNWKKSEAAAAILSITTNTSI